jgi:site-specific recombinase XerC
VAIEPLHVAAYIEQLQHAMAEPTVKQHLAAIRMLFDWLVVGQVLATNPAHALENAQAMAAHESPRTTKLYDRTSDAITLDEVERITI